MSPVEHRDILRRKFADLLRREGAVLERLREVRAELPVVEKALKAAEEFFDLGAGRRKRVDDVTEMTPREWAVRGLAKAYAKRIEAEGVARAEKADARERRLRARRMKDRLKRQSVAA